MIYKSYLSLAVLSLSLSTAGADPLASWEFSGVKLAGQGVDANEFSADFRLPSNELGAGVQSAALSLGNSVSPSTSGDQYGFKIPSTTTRSTSLAQAQTFNHFLQFDIHAAAGSFLNLSSVDVVVNRSGNGAKNIAILSSTNGFENGSADTVNLTPPDIGLLDTNDFLIALDLSGSRYQGISEMTFRLYGWNTVSGAGVTRLVDHNDNGFDLVIHGTTTTAIPEISSALPLASLFTLSVLGFRKRRA